MKKSLDLKLERIHADPKKLKDFILADAKDPDMALGIGATGKSPESHQGETRYRSLSEFRDIIQQIVEQKLVDIMLMSASTAEAMALYKKIFDNSPVTPAARANDTTDIHILRGGKSPTQPSMPFRTASIDHIQCGSWNCSSEQRQKGVNLGLYSITFNNEAGLDRAALEEYKNFRLEAEKKGFRHFLEVFDPNRPEAVQHDKIPGFINDAIARALGGVTAKGRPVFLKIVYHGAKSMEELVHYDPHLVVGILGGSAGTTYDAFKLLAEAKKYGARAALFGRKINNAEHQLHFIRYLRFLADGQMAPEEAVKAYHGDLQKEGIQPHRSLQDDMQLTSGVMNYSGSGVTMSFPEGATSPLPGAKDDCACKGGAKACPCDAKVGKGKEVDFSKMSAAEKVAYHRARWNRILG
ncbi:MAG: hypothetical protein EXR99_08875 [Gemmataceae bacterium]|nr:hypothetical protein [Gemmataceae bacterium]